MSDQIQLQRYLLRRLEAERDNIEPNLIDLVGGNSEAEIDSSIERMKAKSQAIAQGIRMALGGDAPGGMAWGANLAEGVGDQTPADLELNAVRGMDMSTYARNRDRLGVGRATGGNGVGIFGPSR